MAALREAGLMLAVDDFGTGYSSLAYLKRFPIDELKIDRSFVTDVDHGEKEGALVAAIVTLARRLNLQVVAEGVETSSQAAALQRLGCHLHQGYLYARPMPAQAYEALLERDPDAAKRASERLDRVLVQDLDDPALDFDANDGLYNAVVTSTVRSSSLASIMRTGGGAPPSVASACSISVCPGCAMPAAASFRSGVST